MLVAYYLANNRRKMNIQTIYVETAGDGAVEVSILVDDVWYVLLREERLNISHYVELDNCTLGKDLPLNNQLNGWHQKNKMNIHTD